MNEHIYKQFKNPSNQYRGMLFSFWNGDVKEDELREQIRVSKKMGFAGFQMFVATGQKTAYLSDEWFDIIEACCDEAKKNDMDFWLSDEDRWPSGAAGGIVTKDPRFRQKRLLLDIIPPEQFDWHQQRRRKFVSFLLHPLVGTEVGDRAMAVAVQQIIVVEVVVPKLVTNSKPHTAFGASVSGLAVSEYERIHGSQVPNPSVKAGAILSSG